MLQRNNSESDSDEEYENMSTQKLKRKIDEGGLSQTTTTQFFNILLKKIDERDEKYKKGTLSYYCLVILFKIIN